MSQLFNSSAQCKSVVIVGINQCNYSTQHMSERTHVLKPTCYCRYYLFLELFGQFIYCHHYLSVCLHHIIILRVVSAAYDYLTSEGTRATLEPSPHSFKYNSNLIQFSWKSHHSRPSSLNNYDRGATTIRTSTGPWRYTSSNSGRETRRCPWGACFQNQG